ncbi:MAG: universal stress protein [Proteobacteria bacterium]|nr:universal stress protein [Pseudomonadota bacterium]
MPKSLASLVDIGCVVRISEETPLFAARQAMALAGASGAHLTIQLVVQTMKAPYSPFWSGVGASLAREVNDKAAGYARAVRETLEHEIQAAGLQAEVIEATGNLADISAGAADAARAVDLVVLDAPRDSLDGAEHLLEDALFRSGRPVLLASPAQAPFASVRKVLLGWDGSAHAVRACADVMALFPGLDEIEVVTVTGERKRAASLPAESYTRHLARKGVKATLTELPLGHDHVSRVLEAHALKTGADVIAMGAFGHSRLREFLLGGATLELTQSTKVGLFLVA